MATRPSSTLSRDQIIVDLRQGKDGYDPIGEEEIAQTMGLSAKRVYAIVKSFLGARNFITDLARKRCYRLGYWFGLLSIFHFLPSFSLLVLTLTISCGRIGFVKKVPCMGQ